MLTPDNGAKAQSTTAPLSARSHIEHQGPYKVHGVEVIVLSSAGSNVRPDMAWYPFTRAAAIATSYGPNANARLYGNFYQNLFIVFCSDQPIRFEP